MTATHQKWTKIWNNHRRWIRCTNYVRIAKNIQTNGDGDWTKKWRDSEKCAVYSRHLCELDVSYSNGKKRKNSCFRWKYAVCVEAIRMIIIQTAICLVTNLVRARTGMQMSVMQVRTDRILTIGCKPSSFSTTKIFTTEILLRPGLLAASDDARELKTVRQAFESSDCDT